MAIKTGDRVRILTGKDKGKEGKVLQVFPSLKKAVVEGANQSKRHLKSRRKGEAGQVITFPSPIHVSNLRVISAE